MVESSNTPFDLSKFRIDASGKVVKSSSVIVPEPVLIPAEPEPIFNIPASHADFVPISAPVIDPVPVPVPKMAITNSGAIEALPSMDNNPVLGLGGIMLIVVIVFSLFKAFDLMKDYVIAVKK